MIAVACSGFPVPVSRYFAEFRAVEIGDTAIGIPGDGTLRRWVREAGDGFVFTVLAPAAIGGSGFRRTKENAAHVEAISEVAGKLGARAVVFGAPGGFEPTKANRTAVKAFLGTLPDDFPTAVLDLGSWPTDAVVQAAADRAVAAWDPLSDDAAPEGPLAYLRLAGPAGHRSRYDDEAIAQAAERCRASTADLVFCVFRNADMHANARTLLDQLAP